MPQPRVCMVQVKIPHVVMKTKDPTIKTWCSQIIYIFFNVTEIKQLAPTTFNQKSHVWSDGWILRVPILFSEVAVTILETWLSSVSPISTRVNWERTLRQALLWAGQGSAGNSWDVPATRNVLVRRGHEKNVTPVVREHFGLWQRPPSYPRSGRACARSPVFF